MKALPRLSRLAVLWSPANPASAADWKDMEAIAEASGVALVSVEIHGEADLESALAAMSRDRPDALWVHIAVSPYRTRIVEHAAVHRLPAADGASVAARDHGSVLSRRLGPAL